MIHLSCLNSPLLLLSLSHSSPALVSWDVAAAMLQLRRPTWLLLSLVTFLQSIITLVGFPLSLADSHLTPANFSTSVDPDLTMTWLHVSQYTGATVPVWGTISSNRSSGTPSLLSHERGRGKNMLSSGQHWRGTVEEEDESLAAMMRTLVSRELRDCSLVLVADGGYIGSSTFRDLVHLPNPKQVSETEYCINAVIYSVKNQLYSLLFNTKFAHLVTQISRDANLTSLDGNILFSSNNTQILF